MNAKRRSLLGPALFSITAIALFLGLGAWQWRRMEWKEGLIARIGARSHAAPVALAPQRDWPLLQPDDYEYLRVRAQGRFALEREALVFSAPPPGLGPEPGYSVLTQFNLADGGAVLVDRGFLAASKASSDARRREPADELTISGHLRAPQRRNPFTPADVPERGVWYTSDPGKIAAALHMTDPAPFTLVLDPPEGSAQNASAGLPIPHTSGIELANNHLSYAITWFTLAAAVAAGFFIYARGALKSR